MHSRRKFLAQSSLATAALALTKPSKALSNSGFGFYLNSNKLSIHNISGIVNSELNYTHLNLLRTKLRKQSVETLFLSTGNILSKKDKFQNAVQIGKLKALGLNGLLPASNELANGFELYKEFCSNNDLLSLCTSSFSQILPFNIVKKGNIKVGIIGNNKLTKSNSADIKSHDQIINDSAFYLKESLNCNLIILLQNDMFGNSVRASKKTIELAALTSNIDLIFSATKPGKNSNTFIACNKDGKEVILNFAGDAHANRSQRIELSFDMNKTKNGFSVHSIG